MATSAITIVFPNTTREIAEDAITRVAPSSLVLNEGLERLGGCKDEGKVTHNGTFGCTQLEQITIPSTLRVLGDSTFSDCGDLRQVTIAKGSRLEMVGCDCFCDSALEELTLPNALRKVHHSAFCDCDALRNIYMEDGCEASLSDTGIVGAVQVSPVPETMMENTRVWDLRRLKDIIIPEGVKRVGSQWFWESEVESVEIPASVVEIGTDAFWLARG